MWSLNPSLLKEKIHVFVIPPAGGLLWLGCEFFHISVSPTHLNVVLLPFAVEALSIQFSGPFPWKLFHV